LGGFLRRVFLPAYFQAGFERGKQLFYFSFFFILYFQLKKEKAMCRWCGGNKKHDGKNHRRVGGGDGKVWD